MGNITGVSSRKPLKFEEVTAQIEEINQRRFKGLFRVEANGPWEFYVDSVEPAALT